MPSPSQGRSWRDVVGGILSWPGPSKHPPPEGRQRVTRIAGCVVALAGFWLWISAAFTADVSPGYIYRARVLRAATWQSGMGTVLGVAGLAVAATTGRRKWLWLLAVVGAAGVGIRQTVHFLTSV